MKRKILIQTNQYFSKESWNDCLKKNFPTFWSEVELFFIKNTQQLKEYMSEIKYCFLFKLPEIELIKYLDLLYLGISDIDYFDIYEIPNNVKIYSSKGMATNIIAEYTFLLALSLIRKFPVSIAHQLKKQWNQSPFFKEKISSIQDYKIGVLGLGNNGKAIANVFKNNGCWVAGYSKKKPENKDLNAWYSQPRLDEILKTCDIIIVALPLRSETRHIISYKQLDLLGKDSYLINIGRGEVLDEEAVFKALRTNTIKGAALDVFIKEPLNKKSKLWTLPNIIITPHIAGNIHLFVEDIQKDFFSKIQQYA